MCEHTDEYDRIIQIAESRSSKFGAIILTTTNADFAYVQNKLNDATWADVVLMKNIEPCGDYHDIFDLALCKQNMPVRIYMPISALDW